MRIAHRSQILKLVYNSNMLHYRRHRKSPAAYNNEIITDVWKSDKDCGLTAVLQHIVSSCKSYLDYGRYAWRHNSVLLAIDKSLSSLQHCN